MSLNHNILREWREFLAWLRPLLAELGTVVYAAAGSFAVLAAAAEFLQPGFVVNFISPRSIVAVMVLGGGLSLLDVDRRESSPRRRLIYGVIGAAAVFSSFWSAWYYFQPVAEARAPLSLAAAAVVAAVFWLTAGTNDVSGPEKNNL